MSVQRNVVANTLGQLYAALIGIVLVPWYVHYMGVEAYGLVGFFTMLQGWFMLLDLGLTPTLAREAARFNGGGTTAIELRRLVRSLEGVFVVIGLLGALVLAASAGGIADRWLRFEQLSLHEVQRALTLMAAIVALRWIGGLYRGAISGFERFVWVSGFGALVATLRFVCVIPYLMYVGATPTHFFAYQLTVAVFELFVLINQTYRLLPTLPEPGWVPWRWAPLRGVARFALSAAFTSVIWVVITQFDKLLLSGLVPLADYAYYTLAVLIASGITLLASPIGGAVLPRLTALQAAGNEVGLVRLYRDATQMVAIVVVPVVLLLACFPKLVLLAWTGKPDVAEHAAPVLALYAVGNGLLALAAFPYYLQVARGDLHLHLIGNALFAIIFVPLLWAAVINYGMIGAGYAWIAANLLPFVAWLPVVHRRFLPGLHLSWLARDIVSIAVPASLTAAGAVWLFDWSRTQFQLVFLTLLLLLVAAAGAVGSSAARAWIRARRSAWPR